MHALTTTEMVLSTACLQVLTTGSWPAAAGKPCNLPQELEASTAAFDDFYRAKHSGRKLTWHSQLGTADLGCVSTSAACVS